MSEIVAEGIIEARTLRDYLGVFTPLVEEAKVHWNDGGLEARFVDPANVCSVHPTTLSAEAFESFDAPGSATIGVPISKLVDRLKPADADALVRLAVDMETRKLQIDYGRASQTLRLIDPSAIRKEPDIHDLDLPNTATVEGAAWDEALTVADLVSDHVFVKGDPDERRFVVSAEGDSDGAEVVFGDEDVLDAEVSTESESVFSLDYMQELAEPIPNDAEVHLQFGHEFPIVVEWSAHDGALETTGILAPRILSE